jgi:hypothetical protein
MKAQYGRSTPKPVVGTATTRPSATDRCEPSLRTPVGQERTLRLAAAKQTFDVLELKLVE